MRLHIWICRLPSFWVISISRVCHPYSGKHTLVNEYSQASKMENIRTDPTFFSSPHAGDRNAAQTAHGCARRAIKLSVDSEPRAATTAEIAEF